MHATMQRASRWVWPSRARIICSKCLPAALPHVVLLINEYLISNLDQKVLEAACEHGSPLHLLEFILARTAPNWKAAVDAAARGGHKHVFEWMMGRRDRRGPWKSDFKNCLEETAARGHFELMKWLHEQGAGVYDDAVFYDAAVNGHLAVVQWLHEHTDATYEEDTINNVVRNGHFEMVKWLYEHFESARSKYAILHAAHYGHHHILQWIHEHAACSKSCPSNLIDVAAFAGHLDIVKWLFEHCSKKHCSIFAARNAAENGHLPFVQWLDDRFPSQFDTGAMDKAAEAGHLEVVQWLHKHRSEGCTTKAMDAAAGNGHLQVVQWLHTNRTEGCTKSAMEQAARKGHLEVVRWLHDNRPEGCGDSAMYGAVSNGHLEVVKWFNNNRAESQTGNWIEIAVWECHWDVVTYLADNSRQSVPDWGLAAHVSQGPMRLLLELIQHYRHDYSVNPRAQFSSSWCFQGVLRQLSDQNASPASSLWCEILESLEEFHSKGFGFYVCFMLGHALQRGYATMVRHFFMLRNETEKREYVATAVRKDELLVLLRWLLENGVSPNVPFAVFPVFDYPGHIEVAGWMSESDRVELVLKGLGRIAHGPWLLWVLENTTFRDDSSRATICSAISRQNDGTVEWLSENLTKAEVRRWCLSANEEPAAAGVVNPTKRRRTS